MWEWNKGVSRTRPVGRSVSPFSNISSLLSHTHTHTQWPSEQGKLLTRREHLSASLLDRMTEWLEAPLLLQVQNAKVDESTTRHWLIYSLWFSIGVGFRAIFNQASLSDEIQSSFGPVDCEKELRIWGGGKKQKQNEYILQEIGIMANIFWL